jgi:predicted alpha-1,2-mannosidase
MTKRILFTVVVSLLLGFRIANAQKVANPLNVLDFVDPMIGTGGHVHTFPGATVPFGMIQLSPDNDVTGWDWCSGYHYSDSSIMGFSHNHLSGTGWADLGDILLMPTTGKIQMEPGSKANPDEGYRSRFSHKREKASPGYYQVFLDDYNVNVELTASERVGFHKYTFPESDESNVIIDPVHKIFGKVYQTLVKIEGNRVSGYCFSTGWGGRRYAYFVMEFSKPFNSYGTWKQGVSSPGNAYSVGPDAKAWVSFSTKKDEQVEVKVTLSSVSLEGAERNFKAEAEGKNFDKALAEAQSAWQKTLSKFEVKGGTNDQKTIFYTGVYHCFIAPNLYMDVDGSYTAVEKNLKAEGFTNYSTFSYWDTFRATHPLFTIVDQKHTAEFANTLISRYTDRKDHMPIWELCGWDNLCMLGYHSASVIWDAISKGVQGIDPVKAFAAMKDASLTSKNSSSDGAGGLNDYIKLGYVPCNSGASVSQTLEYAYDDFCIAELAKKLGYKEEEATYRKRSMSFLNQYQASTRHFWPRHADGTFHDSFELNSWENLQPHWVSGNIWAYDLFVPHQVDTLIALHGGKRGFEKHLDKLFSESIEMQGDQHVDISGFVGMYGHGDEPGHHIPYLFNYAGAPAKTQKWVDYLRKTMYSTAPDGMINNEDCGQMSAWYIMSALGFYPVCPGKPVYDLGTPLFPETTIHLENGNTFKIVAHNVSDKNIYVQKIKLNGTLFAGLLLNHEDIMKGGVLEFFIGPLPAKNLVK